MILRHPEFGTERSLRRLQDALDVLEAGVEAGAIRNALREDAKATLSSAYSSEEGELTRTQPTFAVLEAEGMSRWGGAAERFSDLLPYGIANVGAIPKRVAAARKAGMTPSAEAYVVKVERFAERWADAQALVVATKAIAVKGRQVLDASERRTKERTIDGTGSCGCCERNVKLAPSGKAVDHGFFLEREQRNGRCPGVGLPPIEVAPDGLDLLVRMCARHREEVERRLASLVDGRPVITVRSRRKGEEPVKVRDGDEGYEGVRIDATREARSALERAVREGDRLAARRAAWAPRPLPDGGRDHLDATPSPSP